MLAPRRPLDNRQKEQRVKRIELLPSVMTEMDWHSSSERISGDYDSHRAATNSAGHCLPMSRLQRCRRLRNELSRLCVDSTTRARGSAQSPRTRGQDELAPVFFPGRIKDPKAGRSDERYVPCSPTASVGICHFKPFEHEGNRRTIGGQSRSELHTRRYE